MQCIGGESMSQEAVKIKNILGDNCIAIYHIGSTAVLNLKAKPIIDIMPIVINLDEVDKKSKYFKSIGYEYLGKFGISGRRYLRNPKIEFAEKYPYDIESYCNGKDAFMKKLEHDVLIWQETQNKNYI